ncbi:MAG: glutamate mutase L [Candidatus Promineifilaceae bacterium]|nr:glutamate mutase L [Candidatus Promineifilaceae bacterium]
MTDEPRATSVGLFDEEAEQPMQSFLVVDCGRANVKATLFDTVEGRSRLVARASASSTHGQPWFDVQVGVRQALAQITAVTGRALLGDDGRVIRPARADGAGVDWFGLLLSGADALDSVPIGLLEQTSLASVRRALATIYAREVDGYALSDGRGPWRRVQDLVAHEPDVILVAGGTEGGAAQRVMGLVEEVALACEIMEEQARPVVIFAGNGALRDRVVARLADLTDVRAMANVRASQLDERHEQTKATLGSLYIEMKGAQLPGFLDLRQWLDVHPVPVAHAFAKVCGVLAADLGGSVLGLDFGAGSVTRVEATPDGVSLEVRADLGLGRPLNAAQPGQAQRLRRPVERGSAAAATAELVLGKQAHPGTVPLSVQDAAEERQLVASLAAAAGPAMGSSGRTPLKGLVLRGQFVAAQTDDDRRLPAVLDGLEVFGLFQVLLDRWDVLPALGLLAQTAPQRAAQVLNSDAVQRLGWVAAVRLDGTGAGQPVLTLELSDGEGFQAQHEIEAGEVTRIATPVGQQLALTLQPRGRADVGAGPGRNLRATFEGTAFGLLVDARRRGEEQPGR